MFLIGSVRWPGVAKLLEETGELQQILGKLIAFPDGDHPDAGGNLRPRLEAELGDVLAAIDFLVERNPTIDVRAVTARRMAKRERFHRWHRECSPAP